MPRRRRPRRHHRLDGRPGSIDLNVNALLSKRQQIIGSTLRARSSRGEGGDRRVVPRPLRRRPPAGRIRPVIDRVFDLADAAEAHRAMKEDHFGKIVLRV